MINKIVIVFLFFASSSYAACENIISLWKKFENKHVEYDTFDVTVTSQGRTSFYIYPLDECESKNVFIIKGDKAVSYASYNGFQYINYVDKNGAVHAGWVKSSRIDVSDIKIKNIDVNKNDFFIYYDGFEVNIDTNYEKLYPELKNNTEAGDVIKFMNVFRTINGVDYKFFIHDFSSIYMESSNLNYDKTKRDFDDYRISKIILNKHNGFSSRGIYIGSKMSDVLSIYGKPVGNEVGVYSYMYYNKSIRFTGSDAVNTIEVEIKPL
ncbi:MAG: hypothetical protein ACRCYW_07945 [Aeromonas sp.]|uniref:hypothetical protein n=1 Tax=Aeromonas sp. TaxID=647 RepID=UPI003F3CBCDE